MKVNENLGEDHAKSPEIGFGDPHGRRKNTSPYGRLLIVWWLVEGLGPPIARVPGVPEKKGPRLTSENWLWRFRMEGGAKHKHLNFLGGRFGYF